MQASSQVTPDKPELSPRPLAFPVIGVGASAGGLEAFETFLRAVDPSFQAAYILVQHLDPTHDSMLTELLSRHTSLEVMQITDGTVVRPGSVYIIPAAHGIAIEDGVLSLIEFDAPRGFRRPIDDFFQSLAIDQGPNATAVVLSGTGADGTLGVRHMKEAGGLAIAQEPSSAAYDGMPSNAIATGLVDFVLPTREIPGTVQRYYEVRSQQEGETPFPRDEFMASVFEVLRERTGHDFGYYKINTVLRRLQRRMQVLDLVSPERYLEVLRESPTEANTLFQELLINVTSFFRDPEVFDALRRNVIPRIVRNAGKDRPVRIWVPGCSSGEEAYSIAILLCEEAARQKYQPELQIFATDIDEDMLARAREGVYMQSSVADMPPELLERYFTAREDGYTVSQQIRDIVRVSAHSVIKDPPFSRLDLVSCRNLLIYFDAQLQGRVLPLFHYALRPEGWLVLGSAENLAGRDDLFETVSREERIYRKVARAHPGFMMPLATPGMDTPRTSRAVPAREVRMDRTDRYARRIIERYAPPHVVVDEEGRLLQASGRTASYLNVVVGQQSTRVLDLATSSLRAALRAILGAMKERRRRIVRRGVEVIINDEDVISLDLIADPLSESETMIVFRELARRPTDDDDLDADVGEFAVEERVRELEDELSETRASLRTTVEELETSNEELKSSNEEMMSMNEELQSANEELSTINEELKSKLDELAQVNADVVNFLNSTRIATIFIDLERRVRSFTPKARELFRFVSRDRGRALADVHTHVSDEMLESTISTVLKNHEEVTQRLEADGRSYVLRALPYLNADEEMDGVVLVFDDVTELTELKEVASTAEREANLSRREIELLYENAPLGIALVDRERRYRRINSYLADYNGLPAADHIGRTIGDVLPEIGPRIDEVIGQVFETGEPVTRWELKAPNPTDPELDEVFELDIYPIATPGSEQVERAGIIVYRVTEQRRMTNDLHHLMAELQHRVKNSLASVVAIVSQTERSSADRKTLAATLPKRIGALAETHNLLTHTDWRSVALTDVLDQELSPYRDGAHRRIETEGEPLRLNSRAAIAMTLVLHELATNAAKYGALSGDEGEVHVSWSAQDDRFRLVWRESGMGNVSEPKTFGFGLRFITRAVGHDLGGEAQLSWGEGGLACTIDAPADRVLAARE